MAHAAYKHHAICHLIPLCTLQRAMDDLPARFATTFSRPEDNHAALLAAVEQYGRDRGLNEGLRYQLGFIVDELVINAIIHGGCTGENNTLSVEIIDLAGELLIEIIDTGLPFNPTTHTLSPSSQEGTQVAVGGVGLWLVHCLTAWMQYTRVKNRNHLKLSLNKTKKEDICS